MNSWYDFVVLEATGESVKQIHRPTATVAGECRDLPRSPRGWWDPVEVEFFTATSAAVPATPEATLSAGLQVAEQCWESFRVLGGGKTTDLRLDNHSLQSDRTVPLAGGVHRIDIRVRPPWDFPLRLQSRLDFRADYMDVSPERLVSPRVSEVPELIAQVVVPYAGFQAPEHAATVETGFGTDFAVSPSGKVAVVGVFANGWRIQIFQPNGIKTGELTNPIPMETARRDCLIAFAGDDRIAVLDWHWPKILIYDLAGGITKQIEAPPGMDQPQDIGSNQNGEVFVPTGANHFLLYFSLEGGELERLAPPRDGTAQPWNPWKVSVPWEGPVAVLDDMGDIHVFEADEASPMGNAECGVRSAECGVLPTAHSQLPTAYGNRRWTRVIHPQSEGGVPLVQVRQDGWLFMRYSEEPEFRVLDHQGRRRIADRPADDLTRLLVHRCNQVLGFDRDGNLYVWHEGGHEVLRLALRRP
jgi:hypothetical protein